ncbi:MAG: 30S ribosomal protein S4, partial [Chloroflexota bacterium]|nr:30S ribosomal protein S4 [Chloroflexota bacterium]
TLNGRKTDIPSCATKIGDEIALRESEKEREYYKIVAQQISNKVVPAWLKIDAEKLSGTVVSVPNRVDIDLRLDEKVIVEYYSR